MSLGVLNNLSAVYAENNLNNTSNSLNTVLQQLSSGSKINSGADDAAGLSLVDGLQANQMALNQSQTNATEGVGLLQVADGALSQVTSLLNRAVTLATEASNGTLNSTQDTAANQEYQSILSEISNIGSTTTYNNEQVFNSNTSIYTGDSSTTGASVDALNIRTLSSSNVGDTGGVMSYSTGASGSNVFVDLTASSTTNASAVEATQNDYLNGGSTGSTSITVTTLSSTGTDIANTISVGGSSGYANTAGGLINAINNSGLGVTASFTTAAVAGDTTPASSSDTGIMISGSVGAGSAPTTASFSGVIKGESASTGGSDIMSGSLTMQVGTNAATTVTAAQVAAANGISTGAVTMSDLGNYINANSSLGVTASVDATSGNLTLTSTSAANPSLKVTSNLTDNSLTTGAAQLSYTSTAAYSAGVSTGAYGSGGVVDSTVGGTTALTQNATPPAQGVAGALATISGGSGVNGTMSLVGTLTLTSDTGVAQTITLGTSGSSDNLKDLAATINTDGTDLGYSAAYDSSTGVMTINQIAKGTETPTQQASVSIASNNITQSSTTSDTIDSGGSSSTGGVATISYTDKSGTSLSGTDLSTQSDAQATLTALNSAITAVAAQDGYIGAQINTLNAVSQVLSTQSENVQSAQNAVQATDYASATSNMSKYEILSQTGISALAQANSMQQEVTKLLQ